MILTEEEVRELINEIVESTMKDASKAIQHTYKTMYREAVELYDTYIEEFYSYRTKVYVRHFEPSPGTGEGSNLYYGKKIKLSGRKNLKLSIDFSGEEMAGGYQYDAPDTVLKKVMQGTRFELPRGGRKLTWSGNYHGRYFNYMGTMENAFQEFFTRFDDIATDIFIYQWHRMGY